MPNRRGRCGPLAAIAAIYGLIALAPVLTAGAAAAQATLSLEETKRCLLDERDLRDQRAGLDARLPALNREADELDRLRQEVDAAQARIFVGASSDPIARAEYEALRDRQYRDYDGYAERMEDYNGDVARYNEDLAAFNARCGGSRYSEYNLRLARQQLGWR